MLAESSGFKPSAGNAKGAALFWLSALRVRLLLLSAADEVFAPEDSCACRWPGSSVDCPWEFIERKRTAPDEGGKDGEYFESRRRQEKERKKDRKSVGVYVCVRESEKKGVRNK